MLQNQRPLILILYLEYFILLRIDQSQTCNIILHTSQITNFNVCFYCIWVDEDAIFRKENGDYREIRDYEWYITRKVFLYFTRARETHFNLIVTSGIDRIQFEREKDCATKRESTLWKSGTSWLSLTWWIHSNRMRESSRVNWIKFKCLRFLILFELPLRNTPCIILIANDLFSFWSMMQWTDETKKIQARNHDLTFIHSYDLMCFNVIFAFQAIWRRHRLFHASWWVDGRPYIVSSSLARIT